MKPTLDRNLAALAELLPRLAPLAGPLESLGRAMLDCWGRRGKVLIAGNGGSAADAMHFAEELVVRFAKNRRALAAIALTDPTVITCAGNDLGYEEVFSRQVEALGNPADIFIALTTSGDSPSILRAIEAAKQQQLLTVGFLGKTGGRARGLCHIELLVPSAITHHIQEAHKILYHTLCEWLDERVD